MPDASSDTDTTAELVDVRSEGRLNMNSAFHKRAVARKEKRMRRAKRDLHPADESSMHDAGGLVEFRTPQPLSSRTQETHTSPNLIHVFNSKTSMTQKGAV